MISWSSRKQVSIAQITAEAEYIIANTNSGESIWLRKILSDLLSVDMEPTIIHCDNQICINLFENPVFHDKSERIEMRYHYVWNMVQKNILSIQYVPTAEQTADILTKPLSLTKFVYFQDKLGFAEREC
jgi:hypothetical protein